MALRCRKAKSKNVYWLFGAQFELCSPEFFFLFWSNQKCIWTASTVSLATGWDAKGTCRNVVFFWNCLSFGSALNWGTHSKVIRGGKLHVYLQQDLSRPLCLGRETHNCVDVWFGVTGIEYSPFMEGSLPCTASCGALQAMSDGSKHLVFKSFLLKLLRAQPDDVFSPQMFRSYVYRAFQLCCLGLGPLVSCFFWCTNIPGRSAGPGWVTAEGFFLLSWATDP